MDMIGRNEEVPAEGGNRFNGLDPQTAESNRNALNVIGALRAPGLRAALDQANRTTGLEIRYRYDNNPSQLMRRSDHWPFIQNGVPGVWIFTGLHPDYHTAGDTPDRINYEKMERILKLVYQTTWDLANADERPSLRPR
jgi:Zn-dependent M28 family amino/carboxypeptidase